MHLRPALVPGVVLAGAAFMLVAGAHPVAQAPGAYPTALPAPRPDSYAEKQRVVVMTDIANEPDDQMSMVRFLVYSNQFDVEGLIATTSTWMKNKARPDVIRMLVDAYEQVLPNLAKREAGHIILAVEDGGSPSLTSYRRVILTIRAK